MNANTKLELAVEAVESFVVAIVAKNAPIAFGDDQAPRRRDLEVREARVNLKDALRDLIA